MYIIGAGRFLTDVFPLNSVFHSRKSVGILERTAGKVVQGLPAGGFPARQSREQEGNEENCASNDPSVYSSG